MKLAGIICEYNPFHSGHLYHINETKRLCGCDGIVCIMSGNFVQRGEASLFDKETRAKTAVVCGADVVFELAAPYAVQTAEIFALNSVKMLSAIPEVRFLSFGAETDNIKCLKDCASFLLYETDGFKKALRELLKSGMSYPSARAKAFSLTGNDPFAELLSSPNNILAVEYIKALLRLNSPIEPIAVQRRGTAHDSAGINDGFMSASALRQLFTENPDAAPSEVIPEEAVKIYKEASIFDYSSFEKALLANIIKMPADRLKNVSGVSEGLENRIKREALKAAALAELTDSVKTKRYTYSSLRRIFLSAYLGIYESDRHFTPPYLKILSFSDKGREILNTIKKTASLPVIKNMKALKALKDPAAVKAYEKENTCGLIYNLYQKQKGV